MRRINKKRAKMYAYIAVAAIIFIALIVTCISKSAKLSKKTKECAAASKELKKEQKEREKEKESLAEKEAEDSKQMEYLANQVDAYANKSEQQLSAYKDMFPDMVVNRKEIQKDASKMVYLTFDDGPSDLTSQVIDVLNQYGVHATFFVTVQEGREADYKSIIDNGNRIQIHTASHDYETIYQSVDAYLQDFNQAYTYIYNTTGVKCDVFRFPGGSNNHYGAGVTPAIAAEMERRGFQFCDWNVSVGDGSASATRDSIVQKITAESEGVNHIVLLAHDSATKTETLAALPKVIEYYQSNGYSFGLIGGTMNAADFQFIK